ncbi:MAG: hypothetical protein K0S32_2781 [Bacteroidetes bacterium]|jgi:hypothetical protein|nr:hypothetical protein [Bacteroidota bacterium]
MLYNKMKHLFREHKQFSFLVIIFIIAEILIAPLGDFPLNDDWSYAKAVQVFNEKAEFNFGRWPAMTLCSHILWGSFFTKIFGFSHVVLRISTMVSAIIACLFLYKLVIKINENKMAAVMLCAVLLFNPIFFNLTNTYMTDVNFCTLIILCCYYIYRYHETGRLMYMFPVFFFSSLLVLLRQFGIIAPVCFIVSCLFRKEKKWQSVLMAILVLAAVMTLFKIYEGYLSRILPKDSTYKFSSGLDILSPVFWDKFSIAFKERFLSVVLHILVYSFPVALLFVVDLIRRNKVIVSVSAGIISFGIAYFLFRNENFPSQNIFMNMKVGPETLYQSIQGRHHATSDTFGDIMEIVKFTGLVITLSTLFLWIITRFRSNDKPRVFHPVIIFLISFTLSYIFLLLIAESYFDRYNLPLIVTFFILFAYMLKSFRMQYSLVMIPLLAMTYISVAGTKDYFTWNEKRWEAYRFLNEKHKVPHEYINGGFETGCWTDQGFLMSFGYFSKDKLFIIQFDKEEGFDLLKEYEFQRYFPYKKDKINIFVRQNQVNSK